MNRPASVAALLLLAASTVLLGGCGDDTEVIRGDPVAGAVSFERYCASCHGDLGQGIAEAGPPLVDPMYTEAVYSDELLVAAVRRGATSDAWDFPIMPAVPGLSDGELGDVLAFVRQIQGSGR